MNKNLIIITGFFISILISGCSSIDKDEAESKALEFVNEKVKFFAKEEDSTLNLPQYDIDSINSFQEDKNWVVAIHVSAEVDGVTKENSTRAFSGGVVKIELSFEKSKTITRNRIMNFKSKIANLIDTFHDMLLNVFNLLKNTQIGQLSI